MYHIKAMKNLLYLSAMACIILTACAPTEQQLTERAAELCQYIPDHQLLTESREYLTEDFYAVLDTMFNLLQDEEEVDHEWLYYFVTGNGGTIADYEVQEVKKIDKTHAIATILVRQKWEDGSFDETTDMEEHRLYMECVNGRWLMSDFDEHKADCIRYLAIARRDQAMRRAIGEYLVREIGSHYLQGQICVPTIIEVAVEENRFYCDCWVDWYNMTDDTLKTVSGGSHSGCMTLLEEDGAWQVTAFEQTLDGAANDASAKRIFGSHYDIYCNIHSNPRVRETCRQLQLRNYIRRHNLNVHYYQDYGWPAVEL